MPRPEPFDVEIKSIRISESQSDFIDTLRQDLGVSQSAAVRYCIQLALKLTKRRARRARASDEEGGR